MSDWRSEAACKNADSTIFFPPEREQWQGGPAWDSSEAKAICATCTVRAECLAHALADPLEYGVWGGTTETERRRMRRGQSQRGVCATCGRPFEQRNTSRRFCDDPACRPMSRRICAVCQGGFVPTAAAQFTCCDACDEVYGRASGGRPASRRAS